MTSDSVIDQGDYIKQNSRSQYDVSCEEIDWKILGSVVDAKHTNPQKTALGLKLPTYQRIPV